MKCSGIEDRSTMGKLLSNGTERGNKGKLNEINFAKRKIASMKHLFSYFIYRNIYTSILCICTRIFIIKKSVDTGEFTHKNEMYRSLCITLKFIHIYRVVVDFKCCYYAFPARFYWTIPDWVSVERLKCEFVLVCVLCVCVCPLCAYIAAAAIFPFRKKSIKIFQRYIDWVLQYFEK